MAAKTTKPKAAAKPFEPLSEEEWAKLIDLLDELDDQEDAPPMMDADWRPNMRQAPSNRPWTMQDLADAGIPQSNEMLAVAVWYSDLDEMKKDLGLQRASNLR